MTVRLSVEDMARAHLTQADIDEYNAYVAEHGDLLTTAEHTIERPDTMPQPKYAIDAAIYGNVAIDETTGLPAFPKSGAGTELKLRNVQTQIATTQGRVEAALDRALEQFEVALEVEDRKRSTQQRLDDMTRRIRRIN